MTKSEGNPNDEIRIGARPRMGASLLRISIIHSSFVIRHFQGVFIRSSRTKNAHRCDDSSMILDVGLQAPCPARVSMRMRIGVWPACADCRVADYFTLFVGATCSSISAVVMGGAGV